MSGVRRGLSPALATFVVALALPGQALAHATLARTQPGSLDRLERAPKMVVLQFDQAVTAYPDSIVVRTAGGTIVSATRRSTDAGSSSPESGSRNPSGSMSSFSGRMHATKRSRLLRA